MDMLIYDQVAQRTPDIDAQVELFSSFGLKQWVRDTVDAVHIYLHPEFQTTVPSTVGQFKAHLAFNYELMQGIEFELIELVDGYSFQTMEPGRMSHFGYHLKRDQTDQGPDSLLEELQRMRVHGFMPMQVSQTVAHVGTGRRYRYAYVTGGLTGGIPIKIIQRLLPMKTSETDKSLAAGRELFACLNQTT
jgi:hypothetical protein